MVTLKNILLLFILVLAGLSFSASGQNRFADAKITTWYHNMPGAVSVTFDDGCYTQYASAYPILEKYKIKGTFSIVGEWVKEGPDYSAESGYFDILKMGWEQFAELYEHGHEISAHGFYHQKYDKFLAVPDLALQMKEIKSLIESRIPCKVHTLHYPYSYASENIPLAAKEAGFLFGRTGLDTVNTTAPGDMLLLASQAIRNSQLPGDAGFQEWIKETNGKWLILMYHHFFLPDSKEMALYKLHNVEHTYSILPEEFDRQMQRLAASGYWIASVSDIGRYITERENTEIRRFSARKKIIIYTITNLDKEVYNVPLTLEIRIPWKRAKVMGSMDDGVVVANEGIIYVDVMPETELIINKE